MAAVDSLEVHDFAFLQRSNGMYNYAIIAGRTKDSPTFLTCDECSTEVISGKHWSGLVRYWAGGAVRAGSEEPRASTPQQTVQGMRAWVVEGQVQHATPPPALDDLKLTRGPPPPRPRLRVADALCPGVVVALQTHDEDAVRAAALLRAPVVHHHLLRHHLTRESRGVRHVHAHGTQTNSTGPRSVDRGAGSS
eukprot:968662_1